MTWPLQHLIHSRFLATLTCLAHGHAAHTVSLSCGSLVKSNYYIAFCMEETHPHQTLLRGQPQMGNRPPFRLAASWDPRCLLLEDILARLLRHSMAGHLNNL